MTLLQITIGIIVSFILLAIAYHHTGWKNIKDCYALWFTRLYWTNYNIVEAVSWVTKAIIIVPGLIFGVHIWWLFFLTLLTSLSLIWASNKKLLPTLVGFNSLWVWISCMVLVKSLLM